MNILEMEDALKGAPDDYLFQQMQVPSGEIPQYLVVSEIQRRTDMRKRYEANQQSMMSPTISEQIVNEGIMGGQQPMQQPVQQQGFAAGGRIGYASGGMAGSAKLFGEPSLRGSGLSVPASLYISLYSDENLSPEEKRLVGEYMRSNPRAGVQQAINAIVSARGALEAAPEAGIEADSMAGDILLPSPSSASLSAPTTGGGGAYPEPSAFFDQDAPGMSHMPIEESGIEDVPINTEVPDLNISGFMESMNEFKPTNRIEAYLNAMPEMGSEFNERLSGIAARMEKRAADVESRSAARVGDLQTQSKRDALAQALIQMGSGIASNRFAEGISNAGKSIADIKNATRAEVLEEQRFSDAQTQAALGAADEAIMQREAANFERDLEAFKSNMEISASLDEADQKAYSLNLNRLQILADSAARGDANSIDKFRAVEGAKATIQDILYKNAQLGFERSKETAINRREFMNAAVQALGVYESATVGADPTAMDIHFEALLKMMAPNYGIELTDRDIVQIMAESRAFSRGVVPPQGSIDFGQIDSLINEN